MTAATRTGALSGLLPMLFLSVLAAQQASPRNLQATAIEATRVTLTWTAAAGANGYVVQRGIGSSGLERLTPDMISGTSYSDATAPAGSVLRYRVKAFYPNGHPTFSNIVSVTTPTAPGNTPVAAAPMPAPNEPNSARPEPVPPSGPEPAQPTSEQGSMVAEAPATTGTVATRERYTARAPTMPTFTVVEPAPGSAPKAEAPATFTARDMGGGQVAFEWQAVAGAVQYRLEGTGLAMGGVLQSGTAATLSGIPAGPGNWQIVTVYANNFSDPAVLARASAVVHVVPPHATPWLTKNNGPGNPAIPVAHYLSLCPACVPGMTFEALATAVGVSGTDFWGAYGSVNNYAAEIAQYNDAIYQNVTEFGSSRMTRCWELTGYLKPTDPVPLPHVLCYVLDGDHGLSVIVKQLNDAWFLSFDPAPDITSSKLVVRVSLDSEGPKYPPNACLSCHGGMYDAQRHRVVGATLLPVDPSRVQFSNNPGRTRADQEAKIRSINAAVLAASPSPSVSNYIRQMYGGDPHTVTSPAQADFVPREWAPQAGLYRNVVKPYCATCHLAAGPAFTFASADNFMQNRAGIYQAVCASHTMPHAELPYKRFWTEDTGPVYLPGLLAAALGYSSCP